MLCIRICALLLKLTQATSQPHYLKVQRRGDISIHPDFDILVLQCACTNYAQVLTGFEL